jgi:Flp pilus assembly pilin Flp
MILALRKSWKKPRGAAALEYALIMPLLFALIFIAIEFTFILYADAGLEAAASLVTRTGRIGVKDASGTPARPTCAQLRTILTDALPGWVYRGGLTFNVTVYHPGDAPPSSAGDCAGNAGEAGDMALYTFDMERPGFTGAIAWITGGSPIRTRRSILVHNEL